MARKALLKIALVCSLVAPWLLSADASAQTRSGRGGLYGDWQIQMKFGEMTFESILAFSRDQEGQTTGQWISAWGVNDLKDVTFEDNTLGFTQVMRFGDQETTSKLTGEVTTARGTSNVTGARRASRRRGSGQR